MLAGNIDVGKVYFITVLPTWGDSIFISFNSWNIQSVLISCFGDIRFLSNQGSGSGVCDWKPSLVAAMRSWSTDASREYHVPNTSSPLAELRVSAHPLLLTA